ncbi:hypothetical protein OMAG_001184 [Candidatus Omnitrophus magneticus]|uniref:Uncharacterized protein n=1 Tax=Candidatus Omnitrophus magneticus TaxID=1609969 RepID=A0A0F0CSG4_9BACT|nr:hypothetical protein OMAG_001184 [Candidatus Omnitrophus magneticus]
MCGKMCYKENCEASGEKSRSQKSFQKEVILFFANKKTDKL